MRSIRTLSIDLETFSDVDLGRCGVYRYAQSEAFEVLLFGYAVNGGEVRVVDLARGERVPAAVLGALADPGVVKWAFNASFERVCLSEYLRRWEPGYFQGYGAVDDTVGDYLDPASWRCSRVWAAYLGLPQSLESVGAVLGLPEQKLREGKELIRYFCVPCRATKANGGRRRNRPCDDPERWARFKVYNRRDVEVEMSIQGRLSRFPVPEEMWDQYHLDQTINDRGILLDMDVVENAIRFDARAREGLSCEMQRVTHLENPNSVQQMKAWLASEGVSVESLGKKDVARLVTSGSDVPSEVRAALALRQMLAKSSVKKYQAMKNAVCRDGRAMGATEMGVPEEELQPLVDLWRRSNPHIVEFWWEVDKAVKEAVGSRSSSEVGEIRFSGRSGMLFVTLPSGRQLSYVRPRIEANRFGGESVTYEGIGATKKWERIESYGPKFVENIVQAMARDVLCYAMRTLEDRFICAHVHDELIIECRPETSLEEICGLMGRTPPWAEGLVLRADGYVTKFYKKD